MLLDPETLRPRPAHRHGARRRSQGARARDADQRRADAVGARDRDAGLPHGRRRDARAHDAARLRLRRRARATGCASARRARIRSASSSASGSRRRTATTRSIDQLQYVARRELIFGMHIHVAVDDPDKAIQVVNGAAPAARAAARALGELAVLARRADRPRVEPADGLLGLPPLGAAAALPRLRGLRGRSSASSSAPGCIADYTHIWWDIRPHPKWGTIEIRICDAVTRVEDAVAIAAYCQALVKQLCERYDAGEEIPSLPPDPDEREQVARRALRARRAGDGPRDRAPQPRPRRAARAPHAARHRAARARARLRARARGDRGDPRPRQLRRAAAARSSTRTATSSRSSRRSRMRPSPGRQARASARLRLTAKVRVSTARAWPACVESAARSVHGQLHRRGSTAARLPRQVDARAVRVRVSARGRTRATYRRCRACTPRRRPAPGTVSAIPLIARPAPSCRRSLRLEPPGRRSNERTT